MFVDAALVGEEGCALAVEDFGGKAPVEFVLVHGVVALGEAFSVGPKLPKGLLVSVGLAIVLGREVFLEPGHHFVRDAEQVEEGGDLFVDAFLAHVTAFTVPVLVALEFEEKPNTTGYGVYEGNLPFFPTAPYTHGDAPGNVCDIATSLVDGRRATPAQGMGTSGDHYYLVASHDAIMESP